MTWRIFVCVELPPHVRQLLHDVQTQLPDCQRLRLTNPEQLHLTLRFLGNQPPTVTKMLAATLAKTCSGLRPFQVSLTEIGSFPNWQSPRVLWIGLADVDGELDELYRSVVFAVKAAAVSVDSESFNPHITIARARPDVNPDTLSRLEAATDLAKGTYGVSFSVNAVTVMRSMLRPAGATYGRLVVVPLGPPVRS